MAGAQNALEVKCANCGATNAAKARFCSKCGQALNAPSNVAPALVIPAQAPPAVRSPASAHALRPAEDKLPPGELFGDYVVTQLLYDRAAGTTGKMDFTRRAYAGESMDGRTQVILHEGQSEQWMRALLALAQATSALPSAAAKSATAPLVRETQLPHLPRVLALPPVPWYLDTRRFYVVEVLPNELPPQQFQDQPYEKWETWVSQLAVGLAHLHQNGLALGLRDDAFAGAGFDKVRPHIAITRDGVAQWKDLSGLITLERPDAQYDDVRVLAGAMLRSKLSAAPAALVMALTEASQPRSRVTAQSLVNSFGGARPSTVPARPLQVALPPPSAATPATKVEHAHATHRGMIREGNEDTPLDLDLEFNNDSRGHQSVLLAVADGMGGEEAGELASHLTVRTLTIAAIDFVMARAPLDPAAWVRDSVARINENVMTEAKKHGNQMGATLVFALVDNGVAYLGNVGDSRIYRWNPDRDGGRVKRLTKDHSLVQRLVDLGQLTDEGRYTHPERNMVLRSIGDPKTALSDEHAPLPVQAGDWLLLCSDGLWEMVRDDQITSILREARSVQDACNQLVAAANRNGGEDNIAVVIGRFS